MLPLLIYLSFPIVSWSAANNLLENPLTMFTTGATWLVLRGLEAERPLRGVAWGVAAGCAMVCGFLSKGPAALFVVAVPWFGLVLRGVEIRHAMRVLAGLILSSIVMAAVIVMNDESRTAVGNYLRQQVMAGTTGERSTAPSHLFVLEKLIGQLAWGLGLAAVVSLIAWRRAKAVLSRRALFLGLVALSASLPVMISAKQAARYIIQSLPLFALCFAQATAGPAASIEAYLSGTKLRAAAVRISGVILLLIAVGAGAVEYGVPRRHLGFFHDFVEQPVPLPERTVVSICPPPSGYALHAAFGRFLHLELTRTQGAEYTVVRTGREAECVAASCDLLHPPTPKQWKLYRCPDAPGLPDHVIY
jgi:4-amino-4-deoxy-L-arabinose transferase-like glycosyltransferase